jgi:hypothetical protein
VMIKVATNNFIIGVLHVYLVHIEIMRHRYIHTYIHTYIQS